MSNLAPFMEPGSAVQISGDVVQQASGAWLASGIVPNISGQSALISGQNIVVSSGAISVVSGSITVNSGQIAIMSGLPFAFTQGTITSGGGGMNFSGAGIQPVALMGYDYSGQVFRPIQSPQSGLPSSNALGLGVAGTVQTMLQVGGNVDNISPAQFFVITNSAPLGFDQVGGTWGRVRSTTSGDSFRLRTSTEGQAPTYSVTATISGVFSGVALNSPIFGIFNYGSGTAMQSGSAIKIKALFISSDMAGQTSGFGMKFNIMRFTSFSGVGAGTLLSGTAMDTKDPAYSGTLAAPVIFQLATSGIVFDATYFAYNTIDIPPANILATVPLSGSLDGWQTVQQQQTTNIIAARMPDTKEIIIRSGYGFGVQQASGYGYTQVNSGILGFNINMIYSVEGMQYTA